jgi:hypothetical protein
MCLYSQHRTVYTSIHHMEISQSLTLALREREREERLFKQLLMFSIISVYDRQGEKAVSRQLKTNKKRRRRKRLVSDLRRLKKHQRTRAHISTLIINRSSLFHFIVCRQSGNNTRDGGRASGIKLTRVTITTIVLTGGTRDHFNGS